MIDREHDLLSNLMSAVLIIGHRATDYPVAGACALSLRLREACADQFSRASPPRRGYDIGRGGRARHEPAFSDARGARLSYRWLHAGLGGAVVG